MATLAAAVLFVFAVSWAREKPGPYRDGQHYGTDADVARLAKLLDGRDAYVAQRALKALGETNNPAAAEPIERASRQADDSGVRLAALRAAWQLPHADRDELLREALASDSPALRRGALLIAREHDANAATAAEKLISAGSPRLAADALHTLTHLQTPAGADTLAELLAHRSPAVRLRAAENALLVKSAPKGLADALVRAVADKAVPVRAAALTAWATSAPKPPLEQLETAWSSRDARMRRAAVRAWGLLRTPGRLGEALEDESSMVRLAAIRAAGRLGGARYVPALFERLAEAPADAHRAAREALLQITPTAVVAGAAARWLDDPPGGVKTRTRNLLAALWLLRQLESDQAADQRIAMLSSLPINSDALAECVAGLGAAGVKSATDPLKKLLQRTTKRARRHLAASPPVSYRQVVTVAVIDALADLDAKDALPLILQAGSLRLQTVRLSEQAAAAARTAVRLADESNRPAVATFLAEVMTDPRQSRRAKFHACLSAGEGKLAKTTDALRQVLDRDRPGRQVLQAAAWAMEQITGEPTAVPESPSRPGETWILQRRR